MIIGEKVKQLWCKYKFIGINTICINTYLKAHLVDTILLAVQRGLSIFNGEVRRSDVQLYNQHSYSVKPTS